MEAMYPAVADPCSRSPTYQMCTWVCLCVCVWGGNWVRTPLGLYGYAC